MVISLPADLETYVQGLLDQQRFPSMEAAVAEGLRLMQERDAREATADEELRAKVLAGIDDIERGEYVTCRTEKEVDAFFEGIKRQGAERAATKESERRSA